MKAGESYMGYGKYEHRKNNKSNWLFKRVLFDNEAISVSLIYIIFGILWILLSDQLLERILSDMEMYKHFQTYKGWLYILITTIMLFILIRNRMLRLKNEIHKTESIYEKLRIAHMELMRIEAELMYQKKLTENIIAEAPVFIITHDEKRIISFNPFAQKIYGFTQEELKNSNWMELMVPREYWTDLQIVFNEIREKGQYKNYEFPIMTKDGKVITTLWNSNLQSPNTENKNSYFVSFGTDIDERKRYEDRIKHLAYYDSLTGLPNRAMFEHKIRRHISLNGMSNKFMIAYIDIDNFKTINDSMGHQVGDLFLTYLGERLRADVIEPDIVARLGGDEFALLYFGISKEELLARLEAISTRISQNWSIENHQFYISMSIGVVSFPKDGTDLSMLLKNADIAMYQAKREGKNRVLFYEEAINESNSRQLKMINSLQYAIDEEQFVLYYQPQFDLATGEMIGMEALVRWLHPKEGFISPGEFIPIAEESGQIYRLERWIVSKALEQKKLLEDQGFPDIIMSINLSGKTLTSSVNFEEMEQIISRASVDYDKVVIEVTETASISDIGTVIKHLNILRSKGIKIALDDFGTGYSSLNYLKMFPINIIKLDKSFIDAINENGIDTLLIKNILVLARDLEFEVIAEGIETKEQLEYLKLHSCNAGQGYLLSRPLPEDKIHELLRKNYCLYEER